LAKGDIGRLLLTCFSSCHVMSWPPYWIWSNRK